ncbi:hypothetical protein AC578_11065 [Pseudocercospora eumusae]|uniref:Uncharacterized protein n=1 Tax=Pseudocercospora eumusae TaxID=321146 RepID=A0A139HSN5_9PEZI|nr:hypothetical protein AC578_11065 [Pseudocercospora eumusae]
METMTANYPGIPHTNTSQPSHFPDPASSRMTNPTSKATRTVQSHHAAPDNHYSTQQSLSAPASQESIVSVQSSLASSRPPDLHGSESNLSQLTSYTDLTSPTSDESQINRHPTPEHGTRNMLDIALASPMSITSPPVTNGAKRTASGHVKNAASLSNTPYTAMIQGRDSRRESVSSTSSRAGEMAANLKARLGYAMAKVQHGWEHKSLQEVELLAAEKARMNRYSMPLLDQPRPSTSGLSNGTASLSMYDNNYSRGTLDMEQPPSKRHSGNYSHLLPLSQTSIQTSLGPTPRLQPAPDIRPTSSSGAIYHAGLNKALPHSYRASGMSPPHTPISVVQPRRPATIRTETQTAEAEREALQSLLQLGSPHTSQIPRSQTATSSSQGQASPMKTDLTPRRVTFARSESASSTSSGVATMVENRAFAAPRLEER